MQLTPHFSLEEFELDVPMPPECVQTYTSLCTQLLEPLRTYYGEPIVITSGYRSPESNAAAHGVPNSQHIATGVYCAADFYLGAFRSDMRPVFDFTRNSAGLEFDQLILEHSSAGDIIHASWSGAFNRREALEGDTANQSGYRTWPSAPGINA
jgi:zinc D-Ala-D-Ala carboxypeptidase